MTADIELLPCPFCGEEMLREFNGALFVHPDPDSSECPIRFQEGYTDEDATAWNRRANVVHATAAKDAEIEALRTERDSFQRVGIAAQARADRLAEAGRRVTAAFRAHGEASSFTRQAERTRHECEAAMLSLADALRDHDQEGKDG